MAKTILLIFILFLASCKPPKGGREKTDIETSEKPAGKTEIQFEEEFHDFETLVSGEIVVAIFVFTNSGEHNLLINNIESDCGCVSVHFSKEPVKPGESGIIEIEFDSSGLFGKQFKSIEIHANTKDLKHLAIFASVTNEDLEIKY